MASAPTSSTPPHLPAPLLPWLAGQCHWQAPPAPHPAPGRAQRLDVFHITVGGPTRPFRQAGLSTLGSDPLLGGVSSPSLHRGVGGGSEFSASRLRTERWEGRGRGSDWPFHRDASRGGRAGAWPRGPGFACVQQGTVEAGREQACGGQASGRAADGRMRAGRTDAGRAADPGRADGEAGASPWTRCCRLGSSCFSAGPSGPRAGAPAPPAPYLLRAAWPLRPSYPSCAGSLTRGSIGRLRGSARTPSAAALGDRPPPQ